MKTVKERIFSGAVCEQLVYNVSDRIKDIKQAKLRPRFKDKADRKRFNTEKSRRHFIRLVNANYGPTSLYSTLTADNEHEIHDAETAQNVGRNFKRKLHEKYPDANIIIVFVRVKTTHRFHFHMLTEGVPEETIREEWKLGEVKRIDHLRKNVKYDGVDHGQDYTGLANYLFDHWTPENGRKRWIGTRNLKQPEHEKPTAPKRTYSLEKPPEAPKGYILVESKRTQYGFLYYKYVAEPVKKPRGRPKKEF